MEGPLHPIGHISRPSLKLQLRRACRGFPKAHALAQKLVEDPIYRATCESANALVVNRMGYSDHGLTHALITATNAMEIYQQALELGWRERYPTASRAGEEEAAVVIVLGALLHDIGNAIARQRHQEWGMMLARSLLERILAPDYPPDIMAKVMLNIMEVILTHDESVMATSLEGSIVKVADGMDCEAGRSRLPIHNQATDHAKSNAVIGHVHLAPLGAGEAGAEAGTAAGRGGARRALRGAAKKAEGGADPSGAQGGAGDGGRPLRIWVEMGDEAGLFQIERVLLKKRDSSILKPDVAVEAYREGRLLKRYGPG